MKVLLCKKDTKEIASTIKKCDRNFAYSYKRKDMPLIIAHGRSKVVWGKGNKIK